MKRIDRLINLSHGVTEDGSVMVVVLWQKRKSGNLIIDLLECCIRSYLTEVKNP